MTLLLAASGAQAQQITTSGDVTPAYPAGTNPWNVVGNLVVGNVANGSLSILNGAGVSVSNWLVLGASGGTSGQVTVDNGTLSSSVLFIANAAGSQGSILITNGSTVTTTSAIPAVGVIAQGVGSSATVTLSNNSVWNTNGSIGVGQNDMSNGTLNVLSGSKVNIINPIGGGIFVGHIDAGARGFLLIDGAGSAVNSVANVYVGGSGGTGSVTVQNGGLLHADGFINAGGHTGAPTTATGTITITGPGSAMTAGQDINIGLVGRGTLNLLAGATATAGGPFTIGTFATGNGTATIDGAGTSMSAASLVVGDAGTGALTISNQAVVNAAGGTTIAAQAGSTGTLNIGAAAGTPAITPGTLTTPTVTFGAGTGRLVFNHSDLSGAYAFSAAISGTGAVDFYNGHTRLTGSSTYTGPTTVYAGTVAAGAANVLSPNSAYAVQAPATLDLLGNSQTVASLTNAGAVIIGLPGGAAGTTLTTGNYVGGGGTIALNTVLGSDGSPSDRLVIDGGSATGTSALLITNAGGGGALTTGDGILVVDAINGGTTAAGAFSLSGRAAAGAYEYSLFHGGAADAQDWFLRSIYTGPTITPGAPPAPPAPAPGPGAPPAPAAPALPNYRVEVPVNMAVPALANRFGITMLGTYHDRNGEDYADPGARSGERRSAAWGRVFGETGASKQGGAGAFGRLQDFSKNGPDYDFDVAGFQTGLDLLRREAQDGTRDIAGLYVGAGRITADVDAVYGGKAGSVAMDGYSVGGYWTRKGASGWYVDAVAQATWYDQGEAKSLFGERLKPNGWGFTASLEGGYPVALGAGWTIEPQAQFIYQHVSLDGGADSFGWTKYDDTDALYGRVGARLTKDWSIGGRVVTTWARANLWHAFGADAKTTFTNLQGNFPVTLKTGLGGSWAQLGIGASGKLTENVNLFAAADYSVPVGDGEGHSLGGRVGLRVTW
jgi:outer membrane autotransporter protein